MTASLSAPDLLARFQARRSTLPGDAERRADAARVFGKVGLPGGTRQARPTEAWKYTSLRPLAETAFSSDASAHSDAGIMAARLGLPDGARLVFVDGAFRPELSVTPPQAFTRFAQAPDLDTLPLTEQEPMVALNTMLAADGSALHIPADTDAGLVQLLSLVTGDGDVHPRHRIQLDPGSRLTLLEISASQGTSLLNTVADIRVGPGAHLTHIRLQTEAPTAFHVSTSYVAVEEGGTYDSFTLNIGARISRTEIHARLNGSAGTTHLNAAQLLDDGQHADFTTVIRHNAPACTSRQAVKNVLLGRSRGVFQGRIEVAREAQKTDGYQMNQALLLSPQAEVDSKPELEIFADDVKCSHGTTIGELDAEQIFYLRSRGVPDSEARALLIRAFLAEALDAVTNETIRTLLETAVDTWWAKQQV